MSGLVHTSYLKVYWDEIKTWVRLTNPDCAEIIDQLQTKNDFPLYKISYRFGSNVIVAGKFHFPLPDGTLRPFTHKQVPKEVRDALDYHDGNVPLGMILKGSAELFMKSEDRVIPFRLFTPGKLIGLWPTLSTPYAFSRIWHMTAGARSVFVLPKITDRLSFKKLCRARDIKMPLARDLSGHWSLLTKMTEHPEFSEPWSMEVLFFSKKWLHPQNNNAWARFHDSLYKIGWKSTEWLIRKVIYDHIWDSLIRDLTKYNIKTTPFIIDIAKYVIMIGLGAVPGFSPAIDSEEAPVRGLQEDFIKLYGLKNYAPTIMVPRHFSFKSDRPVYWSLAMPTHFESTVKPKTLTSTLATLREIRELMLNFKHTIAKNFDHMSDSVLEKFLKSVKFDFFHSEPDLEGQVYLSLEMPKGDPSLLYVSPRLGPRTFSDVSPFVRGCVRFSMI